MRVRGNRVALVRSRVWAALCLGALVCLPVFGATNQATGDIAGDSSLLVDSNIFTLNSSGSQLALVKRAYLSDGTRVPTTSNLPKGSEFDFLIYISNDSTVQINDVSVQDIIDPAFVYQAGTIRVDNSVANCAAAVCTPAEEDTVYTTVEPTAALNDAVGGDVASHVGAVIDAGNEIQANAQLNIAGQRVWAMVFTVKIP